VRRISTTSALDAAPLTTTNSAISWEKNNNPLGACSATMRLAPKQLGSVSSDLTLEDNRPLLNCPSLVALNLGHSNLTTSKVQFNY